MGEDASFAVRSGQKWRPSSLPEEDYGPTDPNNPRKRVKQPPITIKLDDQHYITTVPTQKYLGVIIDSELRFKEHAAKMAKGV